MQIATWVLYSCNRTPVSPNVKTDRNTKERIKKHHFNIRVPSFLVSYDTEIISLYISYRKIVIK